MTFRQILTKFVEENLVQDGLTLKADDNLIEEGVIDSMGLMQMILFIEEQTGVRVPDDHVLPENFQSISRIEHLVDRLRVENK
jgi:acyl carrier protein